MRKGIVVDSLSELEYHIEKALARSEKQNLYFGIISNNTKNKISRDVNAEVFKDKPYSFVVSYDDIIHISEHFGTDPSVISNEIIRLYDIIENYDTVNLVIEKNTKKLIFDKSYSDYDYRTVEIASNSKSTLDLVTLFITKNNIKRRGQSSSPVTRNSDSQRGSTSSKYSIRNSNEKVNKKIEDGIKFSYKEKYDKLKGRNALELYKATAGEVEAYDVSDRLNLSKEERLKKSPNINRDDVVFTKDFDSFENTKSVMFSERDFSYDELVARDDIKGVVIDKTQQPKLVNGIVDNAWVVKKVREKCETLTKKGRTAYYTNVPDIGTNVEITAKSLTHGFTRPDDRKNNRSTTNAITNARVTLAIPQILKNSIEVNRSQRGNNIDVPYTHVLIGTAALEDNNGTLEYFVVRNMVQEKKIKSLS